MALDLTLLIALALVAVIGIVLTALQLPGNWIVLLGAIGYDACYHWQRLGWKWLAALTAFAVVAEVVEFLASAMAARKAGASPRASVGALVGGFAGMILFSIPVPVLGTILGGLIGCFVGALAGELTLHDDVARGTKIGIFATLGRLLGLILKLSAGFAIAGAAISLAIHAEWFGR